MKKYFLFSIVFITCFLFFTGNASAWEWWKTAYAPDHLPVKMYGKITGSSDCSGYTEFSAMVRAAISWNDVECSSFLFSKGGLVSSGEAKDGKHNCSFSSSGFQAGVLAYTVIKTYGSHGESDIVFNENYSWHCGTGSPGYGKYDLETVSLHEMGHLIGFDHSTESQASMYAYYSGQRRDLHSDDIEGICANYPQ